MTRDVKPQLESARRLLDLSRQHLRLLRTNMSATRAFIERSQVVLASEFDVKNADTPIINISPPACLSHRRETETATPGIPETEIEKVIKAAGCGAPVVEETYVGALTL